MKTFKTPKGTELPLLNLKGKDYLTVPYRVMWMREEHPDWSIETEGLSISPEASLFKATIRDGSGKVIATGHKTETAKGFPDHAEKSETGAVGRALALCGYGTQFAQELEEGERIVDAPQARTNTPLGVPMAAFAAVPSDPGAYVIPFGKKYIGKRLDEIGPHDAVNFMEWLKKAAQEKNQPLEGQALEAVHAIEAFAKSREVKR